MEMVWYELLTIIALALDIVAIALLLWIGLQARQRD